MFENILIWFVVIPVIMMAGLGLCRNSNMNAIRAVMVVCSTALLGLSVWLCCDFLRLRGMGVDDEMLFTGSWMWYEPLNIHLAVGVDGISVLMLLLSSVIVFAGTFASWKISPLPKNFFLWFALLSTGVFGFFISIDI
ncbi:MAG: NADH-quinone oxidoreductase subunit M, partial [Muribaculaceae bacterium]|nr:NADH-quinone oxidoreductase subunit M [Muribaculaceae bacterium]